MVAILLIPQAIAYAYLAGIPPQYGLYTALVPIVLYSFLGSSPHLAIGPVAIFAILILAGVSQLEEPFTVEYIELTILAGLLIGCLQLFLGLVKMGKFINLLSYPVITGFTSAASIIVITSQLKDILGFSVPRFNFLPQTIIHTIHNINETHNITLIIAICSFVLMFLIRRINKKIPSGLIVVVIGIVISYFLNLESREVDIIGFVPSGLPSFNAPTISFSSVIALLPTILLVAIIGIIESIGIAKAIENKNHHYEIDTNQELIAIGTSKIGGSFFSAIPSSASFSRSALLHETRAKTTLASLMTVFFVIIALLFLTPLLFYLPKVILAVIIIYAVKNLFEYQLAKQLFKVHRFDFAIMVITFLVTFLVSIEIGVGIGFIASFFTLFFSKNAKLNDLGKIFSQNYKNVVFFSDNAASNSRSTLIIKKDLHFGNAYFLKDLIKKQLADNLSITELTFQFEDETDIDSSAVKSLKEIINLLKSRNIKIDISATNQKLVERLKQSKIPMNELAN